MVLGLLGVSRKLLFVLCVPFVVLVVLEIGVRVWGYSERQIYDSIYMPFAGTPEINYVHKPNLTNARARGLAIVNTDSLGLRSNVAGVRYGARHDREYRIAVVGDSVTFGEGVRRTEETYPQVLEDVLNQKQNGLEVKVFNYGASAYSVKTMATTLRSRMLEVEPNLVLMAIIPADLDVSRTPSVDQWGHLAGDRGVLPKDSRIRHALRKVHLAYVLHDLMRFYQDGAIKQEEARLLGERPKSYEYITQFGQTAERHKVDYSIVLLPEAKRRFDIVAQLTRDRLPFVDLSSLRDEFTPEEFRASRFDPHPSAAVHRRIGESLGEHVLLEYLGNKPRITSETRSR